MTKPAHPYSVSIEWIDGSEQTFDVRSHYETEVSITLVLNHRNRRERVIPYSNVKAIDIDYGE